MLEKLNAVSAAAAAVCAAREALVTTVMAEPRAMSAEHDPINNAEAEPRNYTATP